MPTRADNQPAKPTGVVKIIHISDVHFTRKDKVKNDHIFDPTTTAAGHQPPSAGWQPVWEMLERDLVGEDGGFPVIICISGDLAHTGDHNEFNLAKKLVRHLSKIEILGKKRGLESIFMVPGNHDVSYEEPDEKKRSTNFIDFHNDVLQTDYNPADPYSLVQLHDRVDDLGVLLLCLHSAIWVRKDDADGDRGHFDPDQYKVAKNALRKVAPDHLKRAIRIAMIHHHPVLIPPLVEQGYDAVHNSGDLLNLLREYGFHMVLHGHKHYPFNFTYDARSPFHSPEPESAASAGRLVIVGGGSIGSRSIPDQGMKCNCYNRITLRWNPEFEHFRARIETRRLRTRDAKNNVLLPVEWSWDVLDEDDRSYTRAKIADAELPPVKSTVMQPFDQAVQPDQENLRAKEYQRTHGNMPVVEVRPSLVQGQDRYFEARVWLVPHGERKMPSRVVWSGGAKFGEVVTITAEEDPNFSGSFYYHGGVLIQGRLEFNDADPVLVHVYARAPRTYE